FRSHHEKQVILNIGGMANLTILYGKEIIGFDSGPGNALLDEWIQQHKTLEFDRDGVWAKSGLVDKSLLESMLNYNYLSKQPPKSTGRDEFNVNWLNHLIDQCTVKPSAANVQATLLQFTAQSIANAVRDYAEDADEILVCGGGCHNVALMVALEKLLKDKLICSTDKRGIDPDAMEAIAFAWLAKQRLEGRSGNLPSVTGATRSVILGAVYEPSEKLKGKS
ncbi:MAG: anhydro-N-acetylmuramic acid kinase, partial [Gammaproteobacteria bacterium]